MPKMKPHRGARKRFRRTSGGKLVRGNANMSHLREGKSGSRKRRLQRTSDVSAGDAPRVRRMLGG